MNFRVQRSDYDFTDPDELTAQHRQPPPIAWHECKCRVLALSKHRGMPNVRF